MVSLGLANGRMKDFYDLWAIPKAMPIDDQALNPAIAATFERRTTPIPKARASGLSAAMAEDADGQQRSRAYGEELALPVRDFAAFSDDLWALLATCRAQLDADKDKPPQD